MDEILPDRQLDTSYWYVKNKPLLKNILIFFLILINLLIWGGVIYLIFFNYVIVQKSFIQIKNEAAFDYVNYQAFYNQHMPIDLSNSSLQVINSNGETSTYLVVVNNQNTRWMAYIDICFSLEGKEDCSKSFIYPQENKYFIKESEKSIGDFRIKNIDWEKVSDFSNIYKERFKFNLSNISFLPASQYQGTSEVPISKATFTVQNASAFNYAKVGFYVLLRSATSITAINYITINDLISGEQRSLEATWYETLPRIERVEIIPEVDIINPDNILRIK